MNAEKERIPAYNRIFCFSAVFSSIDLSCLYLISWEALKNCLDAKRVDVTLKLCMDRKCLQRTDEGMAWSYRKDKNRNENSKKRPTRFFSSVGDLKDSVIAVSSPRGYLAQNRTLTNALLNWVSRWLHSKFHIRSASCRAVKAFCSF